MDHEVALTTARTRLAATSIRGEGTAGPPTMLILGTLRTGMLGATRMDGVTIPGQPGIPTPTMPSGTIIPGTVPGLAPLSRITTINRVLLYAFLLSL